MMRKPKITFVGPVHLQAVKNGRAGGAITILQSGGALNLEYPSWNAATAARRALLLDTRYHSVPSLKLLSAIQNALQEAKAESKLQVDAKPEVS